MKKIIFTLFFLMFFLFSFNTNANVLNTMLGELKSESGSDFSAKRGETLWTKQYVSKKDGKNRSCDVCHTKKLKNIGKHQKTGKKIDPLAVSVTSDRLTDRKKINKWFKRNCKWTLGRKCTAQEKGDFLMYINSQ